MTTPTSSVANRSRHETIISVTDREASFCRTFHTGFTASIDRLYTNNPLYCFKEEFEDATGVIRIRKSKKDKQRSTKYRHKTKDGVRRTQLKPGVNSSVSEW